jgi:proteasome lid subunit RPN8/RPN11
VLRFSPTAWAKLLFMRDMTDNEVGGFGITQADDLLFVTDFVLVKQKITAVSVSFEDESVADFFEDQVQAGRKPEQFARIWLHTHPEGVPEPSMTDEATFARVFGSCQWSVMLIVSRDGDTYARLRFDVGPGAEIKIPVCVDYNCQFEAADLALWAQQYKANVTVDHLLEKTDKPQKPAQEQQMQFEPFGSENFGSDPLFSSEELLSEIDLMDPMERQVFMDELAVRSDFWDEETGVFYG